MRAIQRIGCAALVMAGCAGDGGGPLRSKPGLGDQPRAAAGSGDQAAGSGSFGNPMGTSGSGGAPFTPPPSGGEGGAMSDAGPCVVGQFCPSDVPDPTNCGTLEFQPDVEVIRTPGNLLIIFDQSLSMEERWPSTNSSKIQAASMALVAALTPLQADLTVGGIFLPQRTCFDPVLLFTDPAAAQAAMNDSVDPLDAATQINFVAGADFLAAWNSHWASFAGGLLIGTPLQEGFDEADVALSAALQNNTLTGAIAVVAFTDGEPNCAPDGVMSPTRPAEQHAANWLSQGIKTYVVGLPGANGAATLNAVAQAGGTTQYIDPGNPAELEMRLREVVEETVKTSFNSCSMTLDPVPDVPDELLMIVDEPGAGVQQVPRDRGWSLTIAGGSATVEITGGLCDAALSGRFASIKFQYACPDVPPPPSLPPID